MTQKDQSQLQSLNEQYQRADQDVKRAISEKKPLKAILPLVRTRQMIDKKMQQHRRNNCSKTRTADMPINFRHTAERGE